MTYKEAAEILDLKSMDRVIGNMSEEEVQNM